MCKTVTNNYLSLESGLFLRETKVGNKTKGIFGKTINYNLIEMDVVEINGQYYEITDSVGGLSTLVLLPQGLTFDLGGIPDDYIMSDVEAQILHEIEMQERYY